MKLYKQYSKSLKKDMWGYVMIINGRRYGRRFIYDTKQEAEDAASALRIQLRNEREGLIPQIPQITLSDLREDLASEKDIDRQRLRIFDAFVKIVGKDIELVTLTQADWKAYRDTIAHLKPSSINRYLTYISGVLSSAQYRFKALEGWRAPQALYLTYNQGRQRIFTKNEIASILESCLAERQKGEMHGSVNNRREMRDFMRLMLLTAAREGELLALRPCDINWDFRTVKIHSRKGGGMLRVIPLSNSAIQILEARKSLERFFYFTPIVIQKTCKRLATISGIAYGDRVEGGWVLYDFRHIAATVMESQGVPYSAVAAVLGHKRRDQTATYTGPSLDMLRQAIGKLESYCLELDAIQTSAADDVLPQDSFCDSGLRQDQNSVSPIALADFWLDSGKSGAKNGDLGIIKKSA